MDFNKFVQGNFLNLYLKTINISELVSFLQSKPNITKLSLERCNIGDEEAKALANGNLANLTQLDLSFNKIGDEGAKALANGNLTNLTSLNVTLNKIGDEGAKALADLKKVNVEGIENFRIMESFINIAFLIIVRIGHRKAESTARRKDSNRGMFFLALFFIANQ